MGEGGVYSASVDTVYTVFIIRSIVVRLAQLVDLVLSHVQTLFVDTAPLVVDHILVITILQFAET